MSLGQVVTFIGVDVSEARLDVHLLPGGEAASFANAPRGIARLVAWPASREPALVVLETTGGLERAVVAALARRTVGPAS